jgi:hypothetical protein
VVLIVVGGPVAFDPADAYYAKSIEYMNAAKMFVDWVNGPRGGLNVGGLQYGTTPWIRRGAPYTSQCTTCCTTIRTSEGFGKNSKQECETCAESGFTWATLGGMAAMIGGAMLGLGLIGLVWGKFPLQQPRRRAQTGARHTREEAKTALPQKKEAPGLELQTFQNGVPRLSRQLRDQGQRLRHDLECSVLDLFVPYMFRLFSQGGKSRLRVGEAGH